MKDTFNSNDADFLKDVIVNSVKRFTSNKKHNVIMLSGGVDSVCVLYSLIELNMPYSVVNFKFQNRESSDTNSVMRLQEKIGFEATYCTLEENNMDDIKASVKMCKNIFGRVRKVKVETIYAMLQLKKYIPKGVNILSGFGGDGACGYHKKDAILAAKKGEECEEIIAIRHGDKSKDEFRHVFAEWDYFTPFHEKEVGDAICNYTIKAVNRKFPKSALVYAFGDYFKKYKNARKPIGFHKASCEVQMFEDLAKEHGYKSALAFFNSL